MTPGKQTAPFDSAQGDKDLGECGRCDGPALREINAGDAEGVQRLLLGERTFSNAILGAIGADRASGTRRIGRSSRSERRRPADASASCSCSTSARSRLERFSLRDAVSAEYPEAVAAALAKASPDDFIEAAFHLIQADDGALLEQLMAAGLSANAQLRERGHEEMPLLSLAALYGSTASIAALLAAGPTSMRASSRRCGRHGGACRG